MVSRALLTLYSYLEGDRMLGTCRLRPDVTFGIVIDACKYTRERSTVEWVLMSAVDGIDVLNPDARSLAVVRLITPSSTLGFWYVQTKSLSLIIIPYKWDCISDIF